MMISTTKGEMPEEHLSKKTINFASPDALTTATEYWHGQELVHRSVHIELIGRDLGAVQEPLGA